MTATPTWDRLTARVGRNDLPGILANSVLGENGHQGVSLPRAEIPTAIERAWTMAEWPQRTLGIDVWIALWDAALPDPDLQYLVESEVHQKSYLPEYLHLYRGCVAGHERGMSWTDDRAQAKWFAQRFGRLFGQPLLLETNVPRELILARFHGSRRENEWVVDVDGLEDADLEGTPLAL